MKTFTPGETVVCTEGYTYYGPTHLLTGKTYTVDKCDGKYVYIKEIYNGRYGFYLNRFNSIK